MNIKYLATNKITRSIIDYFMFLYLAIGNKVVSKIPSYLFRKFYYRLFFQIKSGYKTNFQMGIRFYAPWKIEIGNNCSIGFDSLLDARRGISIGNNVDIAGQVKLMTLGHNLNDPAYSTKGAPIIIEDNVSIFMSASILPGTTLAEGSIIALDAVVTKDTEPWCIYGGNPAKKIGERKINHITYERNYKRWFH